MIPFIYQVYRHDGNRKTDAVGTGSVPKSVGTLAVDDDARNQSWNEHVQIDDHEDNYEPSQQTEFELMLSVVTQLHQEVHGFKGLTLILHPNLLNTS